MTGLEFRWNLKPEAYKPMKQQTNFKRIFKKNKNMSKIGRQGY